MKFYYFLDKEGVRQGPLPLDNLSAYDISPTTLVWTKGMEKWMNFSSNTQHAKFPPI